MKGRQKETAVTRKM